MTLFKFWENCWTSTIDLIALGRIAGLSLMDLLTLGELQGSCGPWENCWASLMDLIRKKLSSRFV